MEIQKTSLDKKVTWYNYLIIPQIKILFAQEQIILPSTKKYILNKKIIRCNLIRNNIR